MESLRGEGTDISLSVKFHINEKLARQLHTRLRTYFNPEVFAIKSARTGQTYFPNTAEVPCPRRRYIPAINKFHYEPEKSTLKKYITHLSPHGDRIYLINQPHKNLKGGGEQSLFKHLLVVDIDADDFHAAQELAAAICLDFFIDCPVAPMIIPSTNGNGAHMWFLVRRHNKTSIANFNRIMCRFTKTIQTTYPYYDGDLAWVDAVKGLPWHLVPNPEFNETLANSPGWRKATKDDEAELVSSTGYVRCTFREQYQLSKNWVAKRHEPALEPTLRRYHQHSAIAMPCTGRPDLMEIFLQWLIDAEANPTPQFHFNQITSHIADAPLPTIAKPRQADTPPRSHTGSSNALATLTTTDKLAATRAACLLARQRFGTDATAEDAENIYNACPAATGPPTARRSKRIGKAFDWMKSSCNPGAKATSHTRAPSDVAPAWGPIELEVIEQWVVQQLPDLTPLHAQLVKTKRKASHAVMGMVCAIYWRYTFTNFQGEISSDSVIETARHNGVKLGNRKVVRVYRDALIAMGAIQCSNNTYCYATGKEKHAMRYIMGTNLPAIFWLTALNNWSEYIEWRELSWNDGGCYDADVDYPEWMWEAVAMIVEEEIESQGLCQGSNHDMNLVSTLEELISGR